MSFAFFNSRYKLKHNALCFEDHPPKPNDLTPTPDWLSNFPGQTGLKPRFRYLTFFHSVLSCSSIGSDVARRFPVFLAISASELLSLLNKGMNHRVT